MQSAEEASMASHLRIAPLCGVKGALASSSRKNVPECRGDAPKGLNLRQY
jgi:hypothetical protein